MSQYYENSEAAEKDNESVPNLSDFYLPEPSLALDTFRSIPVPFRSRLASRSLQLTLKSSHYNGIKNVGDSEPRPRPVTPSESVLTVTVTVSFIGGT